MPLLPLRCRSALVLPVMGLLGYSTTKFLSTVSLEPPKLVAEAPIWGQNEGAQGYAFLPVTIHGKAATVGIDLENEGNLMLSTAALTKLGVPLAETTTELDSLTIGPVVERQLAVKINRRPDWSVPGPPDHPLVVGVAGVQFLTRYDVLYDFPGRRVRLYQASKRPVKPNAAWLPPGIKPTDCGRMVRVPAGAGTFTGVEMQLNGHPVTGVLEMGPYQEKMNQAAVTAMGLTESSPQVQPIPPGTLPPGYSHNGYVITKQVPDVHMTIGSHTFWTGPVQIFPVLDVESVLGAKTPVMLMNLSTIRKVAFFNSVSSGQVCVSTP